MHWKYSLGTWVRPRELGLGIRALDMALAKGQEHMAIVWPGICISNFKSLGALRWLECNDPAVVVVVVGVAAE